MTPQALPVLKGTVYNNAVTVKSLNVLNTRVARCKKYNLQEMQQMDHGNRSSRLTFVSLG